MKNRIVKIGFDGYNWVNNASGLSWIQFYECRECGHVWLVLIYQLDFSQVLSKRGCDCGIIDERRIPASKPDELFLYDVVKIEGE